MTNGHQVMNQIVARIGQIIKIYWKKNSMNGNMRILIYIMKMEMT